MNEVGASRVVWIPCGLGIPHVSTGMPSRSPWTWQRNDPRRGSPSPLFLRFNNEFQQINEAAMADIFDEIHRMMFDQMFSLDETGREAKAKLLREAGVPEEMIEQLCLPGIQPGMTLGGAKPIDVM